MNRVNGLPFRMKANKKRSLHKIKIDRMCKLRLAYQTFNEQKEMDFESSLAEVACIGTERDVLSIVDNYGLSVVHINVRLSELPRLGQSFSVNIHSI